MVTDLVYGVTRRRRALDAAIAPYLSREPDSETARILRVGAYQILETDCPSHAAVHTTVDLAPHRSRGFVNGVLRNLARGVNDAADVDLATSLSYPDWIVERFVADLGTDRAIAFLEAMNRPAESVQRSDGYIQGPSSAAVVEALGLEDGMLAVDLCAAPGGKASAAAARGARVVAADIRPARVGLMRSNFDRIGSAVPVVVADAAHVPFRNDSVDVVLLDAPCSGLGVLHGRPDARWRVMPEDVETLAALQGSLLDEAAGLARPGGVVAYSVCTVTVAETTAVIDDFAERHPDWTLSAPAGGPWEPFGKGALLAPLGRDAMFAAHLRKPAAQTAKVGE
jgi:16S rRNA (cytosine967-C5)-methyltransferase